MPLTRSAASGNKNPVINSQDAKKAKAKPSKRAANEKEVDVPPRKTNKKATDASNGTATKKGKKESASKKQASKGESDDNAEEPELEESDDALIDAKAKPSKRVANEKKVDAPKKTNKKSTIDDSNGTANKVKGKKEPASKKQALKDESDEDTEEPELEETDEALIDAKAKPSKRGANDKEVEAPPKKTNKKATADDSNGTANKVKGKKEPASKKQALKDESDEDTEEPELEETDEALIDAKTIYEFTAKDIKGNEVSLDKYKGHVCVIVNVASKCGHTKSNYEQFVEIFNKYSEEKGLRILAFPCNQFGKQEPGDNEKICEFVEKRNVKFDMFDKIDVNGKNAHPLWKFLTSKITGPKGKNVDWNFTKFVIDKEGQVVERHSSAMKPLKLVENLEKYW